MVVPARAIRAGPASPGVVSQQGGAPALRRAAFATLAVVASGALAVAQGPGERRPSFGAAVELVAVDVTVTRNQAAVLGLTREDFSVFDDGVPQQLENVRSQELPIEAYLVLDVSASVKGERLQQLVQAATEFVRGLTPRDTSALLTFSHQVELAREPASDSAALISALSRVEARGHTSLNDAIYAALRLRSPNPSRPVAVVFSDGLDNRSWLSDQQVIEVARRCDVVVHGITLTEPGPAYSRFSRGLSRYTEPPPGGDDLLSSLAEATGGRLWHARSDAHLGDAFADVLREIRTRYLLTYQPTGVSGDGWHTLRVKLTRRRGEVRARPGYERSGMRTTPASAGPTGRP